MTCVVGTMVNETSKGAMSEVLKKIGTLFQIEHPHAQPLTWYCVQLEFQHYIDQTFVPRSNVRVYAHEGQSKFSSLDPPNNEETIQEYYVKQFVTPGLISESMQKDRKIEVRFAFKAEDIVSRYFILVSDSQVANRSEIIFSSFQTILERSNHLAKVFFSQNASGSEQDLHSKVLR